MKYLVAVFACLMAVWLVGAILGFATYDPFDDFLGGWILACTIYLGTPIGLVLTAVFVPILALASRASARSSHRLQLADDVQE